MFDRVLRQITNPLANNRNHKNSSLNKNNRSSKYSQSINEYLPNFMNCNNEKQLSSKDCVIRVSMWDTQSTQQMFDYQSRKHTKVREYIIDDDHDLYASGITQKNELEVEGRSSSKNRINCKLVKTGVYSSNTHCGRIQTNKTSQHYISGNFVDSFKVISHLPQKKSQVTVGNVLKIGRMKYIIQQIFDGKKHKFNQKKKQSNSLSFKELESLTSGTCKFCLCDQTDNPDILISPCNCKGSCAQVHVQCLQQWLVNKVSRKSTPTVEYLNYDNFSCELCKEELPAMMKINGTKYNMLKQNSNNIVEPYIVLKGLPNNKCSTKNNISITLKFPQDKKALTIGRGHQADVRLQDVSVSRLHCFMEFKTNKFYVNDNKSKFGTLLQLNIGEKVDLSENKVQIGRITVQLADKKPVKSENRKLRQLMP